MDKEMQDVLEISAVQRLIDTFALATGLNAAYVSADKTAIITPGTKVPSCGICKLVAAAGGKGRCIDDIDRSGRMAMQIGEPYIAQCHAGLIVIYSPIVCGEDYLGVVACGPVLLWEADELTCADIIRRTDGLALPRAEVAECCARVPVLAGRNIMAAAHLLFQVVNDMARSGISALRQRREQYRQQLKLADMIIERKHAEESAEGIQSLGRYPLVKEQQLLNRVRMGDRQGARAILNEMLGLIFYANAGNMELIKARVLELVVVLSRAAVESGAGLEKLLGLNYEYITALYRIDSFEALSGWIVSVLDTFMDAVYGTRGAGGTGVLADALEIIRREYASPLTLGSVAEQVHISPFYLSHIFREGTGFTFVEYLRGVRMSEAQRLLRATRLPVQDIAARVGYDDASYFTKVFRRHSGMTPAAYRREPGNAAQRKL